MRRYSGNGKRILAPRLRQALWTHGDYHRVYAVTDAPDRVQVPLTDPVGWNEAQTVWAILDDMTFREGRTLYAHGLPVAYFAVRSQPDPGWPTQAPTYGSAGCFVKSLRKALDKRLATV